MEMQALSTPSKVDLGSNRFWIFLLYNNSNFILNVDLCFLHIRSHTAKYIMVRTSLNMPCNIKIIFVFAI